MAVAPSGERHRAKVLSTSALRGVTRRQPDGSVRFVASLPLPAGFHRRATLEAGSERRAIIDSDASGGLLLNRSLEAAIDGQPAQITYAEEAPILAARVVTSTAEGEALPPLVLRLATTRGTNALLERKGAPVALFITSGFADLLRIGNQQRDDLFALDILQRAPLYERVVEVNERLSADGAVLRALELEELAAPARQARAAGVDCAAVALLHSYRNPEHELAVAELLRSFGFTHISLSSRMAAQPKFLPRAETAVANAYLAPAIEDYLRRVETAMGGGQLHVMTSTGGLIGAHDFAPKDSLLSGPAGGVVGAASAGRAAGLKRLVGFDMGGTSTDVCRIGRRLRYSRVTAVGDVRLMAPALDIETVAAGGGSVCWLDGEQVRVGPRSAGAEPGPASYGRGGPLTLTDVNLLLGRISPSRFSIPLSVEAAQEAAAQLLAAVRATAEPGLPMDDLLTGLLTIANERMAEAIRRISIRQGYGLADHSLVAFGGAGAQHACSLAAILGMERILVPADAGLLSALGLGAARLERVAESSVLAPLGAVAGDLERVFGELADRAIALVAGEGIDPDTIEAVSRTAEMRLPGQEATLTVDWAPGRGADDLDRKFRRRYEDRYGYAPAGAQVEVESLRVVAASAASPERRRANPPRRPATAVTSRRAWISGRWAEWPVYERSELAPGAGFAGPALLWEEHCATVVEEGWQGVIDANGHLDLTLEAGER